MDFGLLGPLRVRDGTRQVPVSAPRQRVLLAALLLSAGRVVSVDTLAETLWEGRPPAGARGALHSAVQRLRSTLGPAGASLIETRPPGYLIKVDGAGLDIREFSVLAARGHAAAEAGTWAQAASLLREALGRWRGEPLADVPSQVLRDREVPPLADQRLHALETRIDADLHLGRHGEVVAELRQLVADHPLQEQFHAQLMLSLYRAGRQADALAAYQVVRRVLADQLGIDPGPELRLLHQRILGADSELLLPAGAEPSGSPPAPPSPPAAQGARPTASGHVVPRQLPAATRHFAGRDEAVKALAGLAAEAAEGSPATVISVIHGTAGIGKTTLALHFAHQAAGQFPDGQLYVNLRGFDPAGSPVTPEEALRLLLDALSVPAARVPAGLDAQAGLYRSLLAGQRMLVLLDNARDAEQVRPLLPASPGCLVIVTSRSQLTSLVAVEGAFPQTLDVLADGEAQELLTRRLGPERVAADPGAADELIRLCARLPLALSIAAARTASQPGLSLAGLAGELRDAPGRLDALDAGQAAASVRAVLSWSYQQLDPAAARLFRLLGLHAGPDVSAAAAASMAGVALPGARRGLGELTRAHLLTEHAPGRFSSHDLLRAYAAELAHAADSEAERRAATGRMLGHYLHTAYAASAFLAPVRRPITLAALPPGVTPEHVADTGQALAWFEAEDRVLMGVMARAADAGFDTHAWQLTWALWRFLDQKGRWHDWTCRRADRPGRHPAARRPGGRGRCPPAIRLRQRPARQLRGRSCALRRALGIHAERGDRAGQGYVHNAFAVVLYHQGRDSDALDQARQALEAYTGTGDEAGRALALNAVGWMYTRLGDHQQALRYCGQAARRASRDRQPGRGSRTLDSLGHAHQQLGNHAESVTWYQRALDLYDEIGHRWGYAETLGHLGDAHQAAGDLPKARAAWDVALALLDELSHPDADRIRAKLSGL